MPRDYIPNPAGGTNLIRHIKVDEIQVPDLRVTSTVDAHIMDELRESIKKEGILQPLQIAKVGETYIVEDGLHRLIVARELGFEKVPCMVHEGTERDLKIRNLILNRQRGKSNPVHEAQVITDLLDVEKMSLEDVSAMCNLSQGWVNRLYKVAHLPAEVLSLVEAGSLAISSADHLTKLTDPEQQIQAARDAVNWKYTEDQVRVRVQELLNVRPEPQPGDTVFTQNGKPTIIPITCNFCHDDVQRGDGYIWICDKCRALVNEFWKSYIGQELPPTTEPLPTTPQRKVLTPQGWQ
jgi:ParB family chromosome partitioning protein